jgi:hypothetical protein
MSVVGERFRSRSRWVAKAAYDLLVFSADVAGDQPEEAADGLDAGTPPRIGMGDTGFTTRFLTNPPFAT